MPFAGQEPFALDYDAVRWESAQSRVGTTLRGKWRLNKLIAVGGMGTVYDATHRNGMRGAVKILDQGLSHSVVGRSRFLREGRLANQVRHPGAVRVLDDDETEDGTAYLVMELLVGSTLEALSTLSDGKLYPATALEYGLQIIDTLAEAHASGIVHRDIKPENLFLTRDGIVKVLDFGLAGMVAKEGDPTVTRAGDSFGTPAFMAPEQARGRWELVDHQSDLYSLGASLFTLMTARLVHDTEGTAAEMLVLAITRDPPSLREAMPDAPDALVRAIDGALKIDKAARWANAAAMRDALEKGYVALTGKCAPLPRATLSSVEYDAQTAQRARHLMQTTMRPPRFPRRRWLVSVAIVGVAVAIFASIAVPRRLAAAATAQAALTPATQESASPPAASPDSESAPPARPRRYDPLYDRRH